MINPSIQVDCHFPRWKTLLNARLEKKTPITPNLSTFRRKWVACDIFLYNKSFLYD